MASPQSLFDFTVKDANGNEVDLGIYKGKVLLIVNVASKCGMTNSNYTELNQLYEKYRDQGLEILAFPCNQFGEEEPGSNNEIIDFVCTQFKSEFPIFGKIEVNGNDAAPLYKFLKLGKWGIFSDDIQWNFAKFLVIKNGHPVDRYYPTTSPLTVEKKLGNSQIRGQELKIFSGGSWNQGTNCGGVTPLPVADATITFLLFKVYMLSYSDFPPPSLPFLELLNVSTRE
ncbi:glutathione peroxidase 8 [Perilla frutescens var. frutescens]|nr:glutathione peroxidase 8 [Perilla frutescens var. frutescens]